MAMKKADMEAHRAEYHARMAAAQSAESQGLYPAAVEAAASAWDHIDGMMQYERKYENREFGSIPAIDLVLRYAPLLLDMQSLGRLESLLDNYKRITRDTSEDLPDKLAKARAKTWDNHRLWTHLEAHPGARQDELRQVLGGEQDYWRLVAQAWERMGLLRRTPEAGSYRLSLSTRMGQVVPAKCPSCGHIAEAPKGMLLEPMACPECRAKVLFVFISTKADANTGE